MVTIQTRGELLREKVNLIVVIAQKLHKIAKNGTSPLVDEI